MPAAAEQLHQLAVHDLHDLLRGGQRGEDVLADGLLLDAVDEGADDLEVDVRLQEGDADLAKRLLDVLLGQATAPAELVEDRLKRLPGSQACKVLTLRKDAGISTPSGSSGGSTGGRTARAASATDRHPR